MRELFLSVFEGEFIRGYKNTLTAELILYKLYREHYWMSFFVLKRQREKKITAEKYRDERKKKEVNRFLKVLRGAAV